MKHSTALAERIIYTPPSVAQRSWTKAAELEWLERAIEDLGDYSYLGPWLREYRTELIVQIQTDVPISAPMPREAWPEAVRIARYPCACVVIGFEVEADEDTHWSGCYNRTGSVVARMVGDDHYFLVDPEEVAELAREDYCGECGQIGCACDGYDRSEDDETEAQS